MRLDHPSVSRIHLVIEGRADRWTASDQASKNGTRLDGRPIDRAIIARETWLNLGDVPVRVKPDTMQPGANATGDQSSAAPATVDSDPDKDFAERIADAFEAVRRISACERVGLWTGESVDALEPLTRSGPDSPPPSRTVIESAARSAEPVFCSDTNGAQELARRASIRAGGIRSVLALPLAPVGETRVVLYADSCKPGTLFTELDAELLDNVARQISVLLGSMRIHDRLESLRSML